MPITVACKCGQKFAAKDELAGKRVKCPKCGAVLTIGPSPRGQSGRPSPAAQHPAAAAAGGGLDDLLDDIGLPQQKQAPGPKCPSCGATVAAGAVICVECGFNSQTGQHIASKVTQADGGIDPSKMSEAQYRLLMAEKALAEGPSEKTSDDYGDGRKIGAYVLALFLPILFICCVAVIVFFGITQQNAGLNVLAAAEAGAYELIIPIFFLSFGLFFYGGGYMRVSLGALEKNVFHGMACLFTFGSYASIYGVWDWEQEKYNLMTLLAGAWMMRFGIVTAMAIGAFKGGAPFLMIPLFLLEIAWFITWLGFFRITVAAMQESLAQGLLSMFVPFYFFVFGGMNWSKCKVNMIICFVGIGLLLIGFVLLILIGLSGLTLDPQVIMGTGEMES